MAVRHVVPLVWEAVQRDVSAGRDVDAESHLRHFHALFPELDVMMLRMIIAEAAASICGGERPEPGQR